MSGQEQYTAMNSTFFSKYVPQPTQTMFGGQMTDKSGMGHYQSMQPPPPNVSELELLSTSPAPTELPEEGEMVPIGVSLGSTLPLGDMVSKGSLHADLKRVSVSRSALLRLNSQTPCTCAGNDKDPQVSSFAAGVEHLTTLLKTSFTFARPVLPMQRCSFVRNRQSSRSGSAFL